MKSPVSSMPDREFELKLFCGQVGDAWRVHVWPGWLPPFLRGCFDAEGEVCPVFLDMEELDREMSRSGTVYQRNESAIGGVELSADGQAAGVLARWLARSLTSSYRDVTDTPESKELPEGQNSAG
jgi:hypothetical protein